jgi:hypothetical protein
VHDGGTYLAMEGPQFSTLAESKLYREVWGCDVIGMTNMPEAKLAREAELCYASVAMVTDYDSWHPHHGEVDVAEIVAILTGNADKARSMVARFAGAAWGTRAPCPHGCDRALDTAILTAPEKRDPAMSGRSIWSGWGSSFCAAHRAPDWARRPKQSRRSPHRGVFWHAATRDRAQPQIHRVLYCVRAAIPHPAAPLMPQFAILIASFVSLAAVNALAYALLADKLRSTINRPSVTLWLTRAGGAALVSMGILTAALRRSS